MAAAIIQGKKSGEVFFAVLNEDGEIVEISDPLHYRLYQTNYDDGGDTTPDYSGLDGCDTTILDGPESMDDYTVLHTFPGA